MYRSRDRVITLFSFYVAPGDFGGDDDDVDMPDNDDDVDMDVDDQQQQQQQQQGGSVADEEMREEREEREEGEGQEDAAMGSEEEEEEGVLDKGFMDEGEGQGEKEKKAEEEAAYAEFVQIFPVTDVEALEAVASSRRDLHFLLRFFRENYDRTRPFHWEAVNLIISRKVQYQFYWTCSREAPSRSADAKRIPLEVCRVIERYYLENLCSIRDDALGLDLVEFQAEKLNELREKIRSKLNGSRQNRKKQN